MKQLFAFSMLLVLLAACSKDKFETKPQLKLISVSSDVVEANGDFKVIIEYTDKEGDVSDTMYVTKQRLNARKVNRTLFDTLVLSIPQFPKTPKGQFEVTLPYQGGMISAEVPPRRNPGVEPAEYEPDTLSVKFLVKDKGNNKSDSIIINPVVVLR